MKQTLTIWDGKPPIHATGSTEQAGHLAGYEEDRHTKVPRLLKIMPAALQEHG
jgi:hypothetical protein